MEIPRRTLESLIAYRDHGVPPSGFVRACLENKLCEAARRADAENLAALTDIAAWLWNEMPVAYIGSAEAVNQHIIDKKTEYA